MCSGGNYAGGAISAASQTFSTIAQMQAAGQNEKTIDAASIQRQHEITEQGSLQINEAMMTARAARAHSIAAASGSGINLGSNSFLASLQTTTMATSEKTQVDLENEQNAQTDNFNKTQSELNAKASKPTFMGWFIQNNLAYLAGAYGGTAPSGADSASYQTGDGTTGGGENAGSTLSGYTPDLGTFSGSGLGNSDESVSGMGTGSLDLASMNA